MDRKCQSHTSLLICVVVCCALCTLSVSKADQSIGSERQDESEFSRTDKRDWTKTLPVPPGESLKSIDREEGWKQVITLFQLSEIRYVDGSVFISGTGYADVDGGGQYISGLNRSRDPFIELTIMSLDSPKYQNCRKILNTKYLDRNAIQISGKGYFTSRPGVGDRKLLVFRLETLFGCKLVPRR